jgi:1-deoxy-D-xylulose-5-phosphate reductoisomerase
LQKKIAILGSTGSIGSQALEVVRANRDRFRPVVLTAQNNAGLLIDQALEFEPEAVVIGCKGSYEEVKSKLANKGIRVFAGKNDLNQIVGRGDIDMVLVALVGFAGLQPVINAINAGCDIALANKESLVVAGEMVMKLAQEKDVTIVPVDSEHSAIFQCLEGENRDSIEKIYLTASGGPFLGKDLEFLKNVSKYDALNHPNWDMGQKITIDSASLMNKGLEVIEAKWLFGLKPEQIDVIVHPQSIIHSLVQFKDGSIKAQMGLPDMRLPIQYALAYPERIFSGFKRFDFLDFPELTFCKPDRDIFRNLALSFAAMEKGGNLPCILNAANEVVVQAFLEEKINFLQMPDIIEQCMDAMVYITNPTLIELIETNLGTRKYASKLIGSKLARSINKKNKWIF